MTTLFASPRIIAIGGAGIKIAARLKATSLAEYDFCGIDLSQTSANFPVISLAEGSTLGFLGTACDPDVVRKIAEEQLPAIITKLQGANLVYIITGLGGGSGSTLAPIVASTAAKLGALVVSFATLPFSVEGARRTNAARDALVELRKCPNLVIPLPNDLLVGASAAVTPQAIEQADLPIARTIRSLTSMVCSPGLLEVNYASLQKILAGRTGKALFAMGEAEGPDTLCQAFTALMSYPLLHSPEVARHADHLILSARCSSHISLKEINELTTQLAEKLNLRGERLVGAITDPTWSAPRIEVTLIGLPDPETRKKQSAVIQAAATAARASKPKNCAATSPQTEFGFTSILDQRGYFDSCEVNLYRGEDVDIPTYLRRGVKLIS